MTSAPRPSTVRLMSAEEAAWVGAIIEGEGTCQGCDRPCDDCNCGCLLCESFICIEPTKWKALREAIDAVCFSNTPDHAAAVRALLDAEDL